MTTAADQAIYAFRSNLVVTASAGTGKTFRLVTLYVLLTLGLTSKESEDDRSAADPLSPRRIAATTFSRSAAAEIRERIEMLLRAVARVSYDRSTEAYRTVLEGRARRTGSPDVESTVMRQRAEAALRDLPYALIDTLHGLSGRIVRGAALDLGHTPSFAILDEDEARLSADAAIEEGLTQALGRGDRGAVDLLDAGGGLAMTRRRIGDLLDRADEEGVDVGRLACTDMTPVARAMMSRLRDLASSLVAEGSKAFSDPAADVVRAADAWLTGGAGGDELLAALEPLFSRRSPGRPRPAEEAFAAFRASIRGEKNAEKAMQLASFVSSAHEIGLRTRKMAAVLADIARRRAGARSQAGVLGFGDLLRAARDALRDRPELAAGAASAYDVLLVDEFQDTSRVQRDLIYLLRESTESRVRRPPGAMPKAADLAPAGLLIVGDRKQSIYGFRGADVTVFADVTAELAEGGGGAEVVSLSENRRSHPALLRFVNWFAQADFTASGGYAFDIRYAESERLVPASDLDRAPSSDDARVLLIDDREDAPDDVPSIVRNAAGPMREALIAAGAVDQWVRESQGSLSFRDVAILARRRATLPLLEFALARLDVPYVVAGRGLFETREVRDIAAVLRLVLDPFDRHALATVLRGPALALTDASLALLSEPGTGLVPPGSWFSAEGARIARLDEPERERLRRFERRFTELRDILLGLGPADAIRHAVRTLDLDQVIAALPHAPQHLGNVERLVALATGHGGNLPGFVRWLEREIADQSDESEAAVLSGSDDAVTLMTIHASKGLEFPLVVLVDTGAAVRAQPLTMAIAPQRETGGARLVVRHARDVGGTLYTPEATEHHREATAREIAERRRLTYVAMTRAKERLAIVVSSAAPTGSAAVTLRSILADAERNCPGTVVRPAIGYLMTSRGGDRSSISRNGTAQRRSLPVVLPDAGLLSVSTTPLATFVECPRKYRLVHEMGLDVPVWEGARPTARSSIEDARAAGIAAHRLLEQFPIERWGEPVDRSEIDARLAHDAPAGAPPADHAVVANVARFLESRYAARVRREASTVRREEPFVLELGSGRERLRLRGTIDLLVELADRSADVFDYKSSSNESGPDGGARAFQLRAYALAAWRRYGLSPVRAGIVNLSSVSEPADPALLDEAELTAFEARLIEQRASFVAARARGDFPGRARDDCTAMRCGFIRTCHG